MSITKLNSNITNISKIFHLGDVHIRNLRRHDEYKKQFNKLYDILKSQVDKNSIIYVAGDIVHTKTDISPELVSMVSDFFIQLSNIAPTIVIAGNHDANLNNLDRMDALTPIISNIANPNLFYLRDTGLYEFGNTIFSVMSVFDTKEKYIPASQIDNSYNKIALFHGPMASVNSAGNTIAGEYNVNIFDGYNYALLGDIHQYQYLNDEKTIAYCSSTIQQNFGESYENHGVLVWDLKSKESKFIHINNDYGFHTLHMNNGVVEAYPNTKYITDKSRVRIRVQNTPQNILNEEISRIKKQLGISDIIIVRDDLLSINNITSDVELNNLNLRSVNVQNTLIRDFLNLNLNLALDDDLLNKIFDINDKCNKLLVNKTEVVRNILWKPKKFEFSNMFSYGEDNTIDFSSLNGIKGLFGTNATGKSSLLDAFCFCLFDTTSRSYKADLILNTKKTEFSCKFNFEIDGVDYFIQKVGTKQSNGKVKVIIDFWYIDSEGNRKSLNGDQRRGTDSIIQSYIGSYEDFVLTCLSIQNNNTNFIDKSQTDRKEILSNFLDLNVFDSLYTIGNTEYKKILAYIDNTNIVELKHDIEKLHNAINDQKSKYIDLDVNSKQYIDTIQKYTDEILSLTKQIKHFDSLDINALLHDRLLVGAKIEKTTSEINTNKLELESLNIKVNNVLKSVSKYDKIQLLSDESQYNNISKLKYGLEIVVSKLETEIQYKENNLKQLEEHKYDPNCQYCIDNVFVKEANRIKLELPDNKDAYKIQRTKLDNIEIELKQLQPSIAKLTELQSLTTELNSLNTEVGNVQLTISKLNLELSKLQNELNNIVSDIQKYESNKAVVDANIELENEIESIKSILSENQLKYDNLKREELNIFSEIKLLEYDITNKTNKLNDIQEKIYEKAAYEYYLQCVDKDGISYYLISKILPKIENEINNILTNIVDFRLILNTDGKNINAYIVYEDSYWPMELSSGMERFISSIAIRIALVRITSLPKSQFFIIDEGLGVLDTTNLNQMYLLFNYMRDVFKFTLIISHIDIVKDMVDSTLQIQNINGFSKLKY